VERVQQPADEAEEKAMKICRKCGQMIDIIEYGVYRKVVVDAVPYYVKADPDGEQFVRIDGSKVKAKEVPFETDGTEPAYKPHKCGGRG
jgi:hypothetical protein